jgi:glycosyltransferase involved in cell wall biosynthesis
MADKILYTTTSYLPAIGGAQLHTHQIVRRLSTRYSVQVVTQWAENRTDWLLGTTLRAPAEPKSYVFEDIPVQLITLTSEERWRLAPYVLGYYAFKALAIDHIATILIPKIEPLARDCRLIHNVRIGREPLSFASWRVARKLDIPFIFVPYHHPRWIGWNYRDYLKLYRQADALIALTQAEKAALVRLGVADQRIFVTGNGPYLAETGDANRFRQNLQLPPGVPLILFLGQKYRYKGIEPLAAAAQIVWQKWPEVHFLFIGPRTPFSKRFFARQSDSRLIELDTVDLQQKTDALAACTLLCLPSTQESFGGVFTEAWSFGKPVIGADIPAIREVIDNGLNGYLVAPTAEALAERICYLLQNPSVGDKLGQAGRAKTLQFYSWERLAQKTEEIYTRVLRGTGE